MGNCQCGNKGFGGRRSVDLGLHLDEPGKLISPEYAETVRKLMYGSNERNIGFADKSSYEQIEAQLDVASYSEELFYLRLGAKAPLMIEDFGKKVVATNSQFKNESNLTPEQATALVLGLREDDNIEDTHFQQRITRLFRILVHPTERVDAYAYVSMRGLIESPADQWQFFFLFADIDEDSKVSFSDMEIAARTVIDFTLLSGHASPETLTYAKLSPAEQSIGLEYFIRKSFDAPLDEHSFKEWRNNADAEHRLKTDEEFKQWFETSPMQGPMDGDETITPDMMMKEKEAPVTVGLSDLQKIKRQTTVGQKEPGMFSGDAIEAF